MKRWRWASRLTFVLALAWLTLSWLTGCSRQTAGPVSTGATGSAQLPFDRTSDGGGVSPTAAFAFDGIPAGTEFTIRLRTPLSSAQARVGDSFDAVLDQSVVVAGKTVVPRGAPVTGSVVATKVSTGQDPGYLRMTLSSVAINGRSIPLQTSSLFIKGGSHAKRAATTEPTAGNLPFSSTKPGDVRFSTGHRFTFRLIQPLHLSN
jgi:hypothetical protein